MSPRSFDQTQTVTHTTPTPLSDTEIAVVGTGPVGLLAALTLARIGYRTTLVGPAPNLTVSAQNARTAALFPASIELLRQLNVWRHCEALSAPLTAIRIVDDLDDAILRAPEVLFAAAEIGAANFGYNVPNDVLVRSLWQALGDLATNDGTNYKFVETAAVTGLDLFSKPDNGGLATLSTREGRELTAQLIVAADGRKSLCRDAAGLATRTWSYPQAAVTCVFAHERPHQGISTELHRASGPCTTVPMPGNRSSLVWMETPKVAERLAGLSDEAFAATLEHRLHAHLGGVSDVTPRAVFPLSGLSVPQAGGRRVALVGEAAHVMPPIGAQGLNLGFRDVAQLASSLQTHTKTDPGQNTVLSHYSAARKPDITARVWGVDLLNRSLLAGSGAVHVVRGAGLAALKSVGPLRRQVVRQGLEPLGPEPKFQLPPEADSR